MGNPIKMFIPLLLLCATSCATVEDDGVAAAVTQVGMFRTALEAFDVDCGRFPSSNEGLSALITRPTALSDNRWRGPYLQASAIPRDPWGHEYVYCCPGKHNTNTFDLYSLGTDGVSKTGGADADDIASWPKGNGHQ